MFYIDSTCRDGAKADNVGNVYFIATPLLMDDVKPGLEPSVTKGVVYYINVGANAVSALPSTEGASGFAAVSLSNAKSNGAGTCVVGIGFLRSKIAPLQASTNYGQDFARSYDYMVATPTSPVASLILTALSKVSAFDLYVKVVKAEFFKFGSTDLTVAFAYAANIVVGSSANGDPLLYTVFSACKAGVSVSDCSSNFATNNPYGQLLVGVRANLNAATGA